MNNFNQDFFKIGEPLDAVVYDANTPFMACTSCENRSSTIVYASDSSMHLGTITNGNWVANKNGHLIKNEIQTNFVNTINTLKSR